MRRVLNSKSPAASTLSFLKADGIKAVDDSTVSITTDTPIANLPEQITVKYSLIVPDGAKSEDLKLHEDGTGPFMQQTFSPAETKRILVRNPTYWRAGLPKAKCLEMSVMTEEVPRTAALQSGAVDLILVTSAASVGPSARMRYLRGVSPGTTNERVCLPLGSIQETWLAI